MTRTTFGEPWPRLPYLPMIPISLLQPKKAKYRSALTALTALIFLSAYFLIIRPSVFPSQAMLRNNAPAANQFTSNSRLPAPIRNHKKLSRIGEQVALDQHQELAAISSFLTSLSRNIIPLSVDPSVTIDPQLVLDFDTRSARAAEEVQHMVKDVWERNPVLLYSKLYSPASREIKAILTRMNLQPSPTIIDVDIRDDAKVVEAIICRLTLSLELPVLLIGGRPIGSIEEIRALEESGELHKLVTASGAVIDGSKKVHRPR
ncbi:hypothetical protein C0993_001663 [Termitomyces sp. T159_Od127]|nr:hypothetical protein C0993_001663 [Termitomyces sp. T159_Od127]